MSKESGHIEKKGFFFLTLIKIKLFNEILTCVTILKMISMKLVSQVSIGLLDTL